MLDAVRTRLDVVARVLPTVAGRVMQWVARGYELTDDGILLVGPDPSVAPCFYRASLFPPPPETWLAEFEARQGLQIPAGYRCVLAVTNGLSFLDLDLFGLSAVNLLNRGARQPLQLARAVSDWAAEYGRSGSFHFGSAPWTDDVNCGYFWSPGGPFAALPSGLVLRSWRSIEQLVADEIDRLEASSR